MLQTGQGPLMARISHQLVCLAAALTCLLCAGCLSGNELGGVWRPVQTDGKLIYDEDSGEPTVGFEFWMEHYGPDIVGLIRFYRPADDFTAPYEEPRKPDTAFQCACIYMHGGRYSETLKSYKFSTKGCLPGTARNSSVLLSGAFKLNDEGQLKGTLQVDKPVPSPDQIEEMTLEREAAAGSILASEFVCDRITDADAGNTYSGW